MNTDAAPAPTPSRPGLGAVVIGRNEGERLLRCLQSVRGHVDAVVYVDSGSTDRSIEQARALGAAVVELDMGQPFTAARARNAGLQHLLSLHGPLELVQFIDGDCEVQPAWWTTAADFLCAHPHVAVACGRRRERHPERSVFNRLCDIEWDTPVGEATACGGDALMRAAAVRAVGGYRDDLIAGEEPELCVRLRAEGWQVWRLDAEMTLHDAAMTRWTQWWQRTRRAGHAFAEGAALHGRAPGRHCVRESRRAMLWGVALPLVAGVLSLRHPAGLALWAFYPLQMLRVGARLALQRRPIPWTQAFFLVAGRLPEGQGALRYWWNRWCHRRSALIEYK